MTTQRYFIAIDDLARARGESHELSFHGGSPESLATLLQDALRTPSLWERWRNMQAEPDAIDPLLGATDPSASVVAKQDDLHADVQVVTSLPHAILKHRLDLLIGKHWTLRDVKSA
jgi:hypothetical protein